MNILVQLLDFVFNVLIVLLFVRYFVDEQSFFQFGPFLTMLQQATDPFIKPIRRFIVGWKPKYHTWAPFIAVALVVAIRGLVYIGLDALAALSVFRWGGMLRSFERAADVLFMFIVAMLFAGTMFSRSGFVLMTSAGFRAFQEGTFKAFRVSRMIWRTDRIWPLFWGSVAWLLLLHFVAVSVFSLRVFGSGHRLLLHELYFMVHAAVALLQVYWFVLLVAIVASWLTLAGSGGSLPVVRGVRALAEPYFHLFRRMTLNKLRWGMIDFSPILAFIALAIVTYYLQVVEIVIGVRLGTIRGFL